MADKIKIATAYLCGCFGCHMSLLDIDEELFELVNLVEFDRSPINDIKVVGDCDIGIIEGGVANANNVEVLWEFRKHCKILVAMGACAINGGIPAMRNSFTVKECLEESYLNGIGIDNPMIPSDPELPLLLNKVQPIHEVVKIDYFVPGCPPSADTIWTFLSGLIEGKPISLTYEQIRYD
jgi:NAD-reducing hydrogenase small subunit